MCNIRNMHEDAAGKEEHQKAYKKRLRWGMKKTKNESTKYKLPKKKLTKGLDLTPLFVRGFIP